MFIFYTDFGEKGFPTSKRFDFSSCASIARRRIGGFCFHPRACILEMS